MGPCITKDKSNKAFLRDLFIKIEEKNIKKPYITAVINIKPNEKLKIPENPSLILLEKKELRKTLDEKYLKLPNFFNVNEKALNEESLYGAVGLFNLGNTCFINSAIQLLSNTQPLTDYFLSGLHIKEINEKNPFSSQGAVVYQFGLLLKELWLTKEPAIEPNAFMEVLKQFAPRFAEGNQEDIQEFLLYLLDIIHEDLNRAFKGENNSLPEQIQLEIKENSLKKEFPGLSEQELLSATDWQGYLLKNRSIIVDLFQGQVKNSITCLKCNSIYYKFEPIMYISLPIPQSQGENEEDSRYDIDLMDCIREFTKEEVLDNTEMFFCENCKEKVKCSKRIDIWKMPNILVIHFKRFRYNKKQRKKMDTYINFPLQNLDLTAFQALEQKEKPIYDLFGVANHEGTLNKGHYYTFAKNDEDKKWYIFDDELVKMVKKPQKQIVSCHAYMLFYAKTSNDYFFRQTLTAPELWPHLIKIQEALFFNNTRQDPGKIRSSTGIRESLRIHSITTSLEEKVMGFRKEVLKGPFDKGMPLKYASRSSEGVLKRSFNNFLLDSIKEHQSEKGIKGKEEEDFFERLDSLADKKMNKNKRGIIVIEEEEKGNEGGLYAESEVLKGRMPVEFTYREEEHHINGVYGKKIEIINS